MVGQRTQSGWLGPRAALVARWPCAAPCCCSIILSLAELQLVRTSEKLTVMYLLDQSASIPPGQRQQMLDYVNAEVKKHRRSELGDRAGVIFFGSDASLAYPPWTTRFT